MRGEIAHICIVFKILQQVLVFIASRGVLFSLYGRE